MVIHLNLKTTITFFWSSVILMPMQAVHTPDSLKAWVNLERGSVTAMVNIFLNTPCKTTECYYHKMGDRTSWTSRERVEYHLSSDGTSKRNSYRNQIDYIICKNMHEILLQKSKLYGGTGTKTDHKLVKATFRMEW